MSIIYILRHGQSAANVDLAAFETYGNMRVPVTEEGKSQIQEAGEAIKQELDCGSESWKKWQDRHDGLAVFSSMYHRCMDSASLLTKTLGIDIKINPNLLLSEINCGEQEGCNVEAFEERPIEKMHHRRIGALQYKPYRGESYLDIHTRTGLFVTQQNFFQYIPVTIIVGHASTCLMMHYFLTHTCPDESALTLKASEYWPNAMVRKYTKQPTNVFRYNGVLQNGINDVLLISRDAQS